MDFDKIQEAWAQGKNEGESNVYTVEQLSSILARKSSIVTGRLIKGIVTSLGLNVMLLFGVIYVLGQFGQDPISKLVSVFCLVLVIILSIHSLRSWLQLRKIELGAQDLKAALKQLIDFFDYSYFWVVWSLALSGPILYSIGGLIYHNSKYGQVRLETIDVIVNIAFITLALVIGYFANNRVHSDYRKELEACFIDLNKEELSSEHEAIEYRQRRLVARAWWLIAAGLLLFIILLYSFFKS